MADISKITTLDGTTYNLKDAAVPAWAKASTKPTYTAAEVGAIATTEKGDAGGVAELDSGGKVPTSQLPSYVDDVLEYSSRSAFPSTGETGKIYVATDTNITYRWSGSAYVEISPSLALGETSSTAYRGDRGAAAYAHATDADRATTAAGTALYKVAITAEGHVASVAAAQKTDITALGIPGQDTTYSDMTGASSGAAGAHGLVPAPAAGDDGKYLRGDGTWAAPPSAQVSGVKGDAESTYRTGNVNLTAANIGAVSKTGDTMTGNLSIKKTTPNITFYNSNGSAWAAIIYEVIDSSDNNRLAFGVRKDGSDGQEVYFLPAPDTHAAQTNYGILTTKSPVSIGQGGTGATTASAAISNLGISVYISAAQTWADIYPKLDKIPVGHGATIYIAGGSSLSVLTGGQLTTTNSMHGIVSRNISTSSTFHFDVCQSSGSVRYSWYITGLSSASSTPTAQTVYKYTGTAV